MTPAYAIVCGSGSSGRAWDHVATELRAVVLPAPDAPDVPAMALQLAPAVAALPRPRVLIGTSLGALIALELARDTPVDALILVSAGFGIDIHPTVLERIAAAGPAMLDRMARGVVAQQQAAKTDAAREAVANRRAKLLVYCDDQRYPAANHHLPG